MASRTSRIVYWVLTGLVAIILTGSALGKLAGGAQSVAMAEGLGGTANLFKLGITELLIVLLWLIPRTGILATLLAAAYLGGAMAVHFVNNQSLMGPAIIQAIIWVVAVYRFPELSERIFGRKK